MKLSLHENLSSYCVAVGAALELRNDPVIRSQSLLSNSVCIFACRPYFSWILVVKKSMKKP